MIAKVDVSVGATPGGWDDLVARLGGSIFHSAVWADYQRRLSRSRPLFLLARDEHGAPQAAAVALLKGSRRPLLSRLVRELWLPSHPAVAGQDAGLAEVFVGQCELVGSGFGCARLSMDSFMSGRSSFRPAARGYRETERVEFTLDLGRDLDSLWQGIRKDQREKIRRLARQGVTLDPSTSLEDVLALADARDATRSKRALRGQGYELPSDREFYERLYEDLVKPGGGKLFLARSEGRVIAALLFLTFNRRAYSMFSGSDEIGHRLGAQSGLFWTAVETFKAEGFRELNRGGLPASAADESDPLHGIYLFKLRLGTTPVPCRSGQKVLSPWRERLLRIRERRWR